MISRLGRLLRLSNRQALQCFSTSDGENNRGKGGRGGFFSNKRDSSKEEPASSASKNQGQSKDTHKTIKFLKKHEVKMRNLEPQPQKQLRFRKKSTQEESQAQKPAPFVKPEREQTEEEQIKKSIFFSKTSATPEPQQKQTLFEFQLPQLNSFLNSPSPSNAFYQRFSQDLDDILSLFNSKKWKELNYVVEGYSELASAEILEKQLHTTLISHNAQNYVLWLQDTKKTYNDLSNSTIKKIYKQLLKQDSIKQLNILLQSIVSRFKTASHQPFSLQYQSIQAFLSDVQKDSPLKGLQQKVDQKIDTVLLILEAQFAFRSYEFKVQSQRQQKSYFDQCIEDRRNLLDQWFDKLAHLALDRQVSQTKFRMLFQQICLRHYPSLNLDYLFDSGLFLRIIQTFYFGSYITTQRLQELFAGFVSSGAYQDHLQQLRKVLGQYKARTGKFAFPNAKKLVQRFQQAFKQNELERCLFYFVLVVNSDEQKDTQSFMKKRAFLVNHCRRNSIYQLKVQSVLNDALFALPEHEIKSVSGEKTPHKVDNRRGKNRKKSQNQSSLESESLDWNVQKTFPEEPLKSAQELGWNSGIKHSYFTMLTRQMQREQNPYRRQLLRNILKADLKADSQKFQEQQPDSEDIRNSYLGRKLFGKQGQLKKDLQSSQQRKQQQAKGGLNLLECASSHLIDRNIVLQQENKFNNRLAIQSAIKLKKYQIAYALCEKMFMESLIHQRTTQNILLVLKLFLLEENRKKPIEFLEDVLESIHEKVLNFEPEYIRSVYERFQNFDDLITGYLPPQDIKFQYWSTTLAMDRAQDLLKMDISNRLKSIKYEAEYESPPIPKDAFIKRHPESWRQKLMGELGITKPLRYNQPVTEVSSANNQQEFFQKFLMKKMFNETQDPEIEGFPKFEDIIQEEEGAQEQLEQTTQQGEATQQAEHSQEVQAADHQEAQQAQQGQPQQVQQVHQGEQGEQVQQMQGQQASELEQTQTERQNQQLAASKSEEKSKADSKQEEEVRKQIQSNQEQLIRNMLGHRSNINASEGLRIKGYDFNSFLSVAKTKIKPIFESEYEEWKQFKKHMINLESLTEQTRLQDVHFLQQKLDQYQKNVRSPSNIFIFMNYGLWDFDFSSYCLSPRLSLKRAAIFRKLFFRFKTYEGKKGFAQGKLNSVTGIFNNEQANMQPYAIQVAYNSVFNENLINQLLIRRMRFFKEADAVVRLQPVGEVEEMMGWGLQHDEPMAIYLAEKIAMLTNQTIPHQLALKVASYLSHRQEIPAERIERCKECLKVVGRINREKIYDFNYDYAHITARKGFNDYLAKRSTELSSTSLEFLSRVNPTASIKNKKELLRNLKKIDLVA